MRFALWTVQVLLALAFVMAGGMKLTAPIAELAAQMAWVDSSPALLVRFIGLAEVLGAIGLIVPAATRILPWLTALAGAGLATVMALAIPMHIALGEPEALVPVTVLMGLAIFVAVGRSKLAPIEARTPAPTPAHA